MGFNLRSPLVENEASGMSCAQFCASQPFVRSVVREVRLLYYLVQNMVEMLQQQYPQQLMPDLAQQIQGCLQVRKITTDA